MENSIEILVPISFFALAFGIVYLIVTNRNKERMKLIEKGVDLSTLNPQKKSSLKEGLFALGLALGLLSGALLKHYTILGKISFPIMVFIFVGIALLLNDFIERKRN